MFGFIWQLFQRKTPQNAMLLPLLLLSALATGAVYEANKKNAQKAPPLVKVRPDGAPGVPLQATVILTVEAMSAASSRRTIFATVIGETGGDFDVLIGKPADGGVQPYGWPEGTFNVIPTEYFQPA